ncbi:ATP-binding protein [Desulfovibrio aminophilus]|uniref:ATP-binding protein n=1 Tax=Desulfovibrio aminophilus TaxID=81425 RepID=UPI003393A54B
MKRDDGPLLRLRIASRLEQVAGAGRAVAEFARNSGLPPAAADELELAVCEAVNNAIRHAYDGTPERTVEIVASSVVEGIDVVVRDTGRALTKPLPTRGGFPIPSGPSRLAGGGMGLRIMVETMDEVRYSSKDGVNELALRKRRLPPGR